MASIEVPAAKTVKCSEGEASSIPSVPAREPQHNQPTTPSAPSDGTDEIGQQALADPPKSLFGPFPTTTVASNIEQKAAVSAESGYTPVSPPGTRTNPFQPPLENIENGHQASPLRFDFNPGERESLRTNQTNQPASPRSPTLPPLTREKTAPAIGPATDKPTPFPKEVELEGPVLYITLLLSSTGARHPFRLDEKYLRKRNVTVEGNNPFNISLYKLKELILRDWREEWEAKPSSPESIRLISMGKMLNDKARLSDSGFTNGLTPHIIHMTVKPQEIVDEEDAKMKSGGRDRDSNERSPGCRCVIQ